MLLVDASIWIDHFRHGVSAVRDLASRSDILMHPLVLTEIALGSLPDRQMTLRYLHRLIAPIVASEADVARLIEGHRLFGAGLDFVDVHLLASARLTECELWTRDGRLHMAADKLGVAFTPA